MYAVIDLETTGLHTSRHDRVVEIAIVHVGPRGDIESEWCTLVNPERDLGPQHIHGITAAEARVAPRFAQLAGAVAGRLRGRVPVAHNWAFDGQFLAAEFARMGIVAPVRYEAGLCTMRLAGQFFPGSSRGLADCCAAAGIALTRAHSALHDARAAARLLAHFLRVTGQPPPWAHRFAGAPDAWPALADSGVALVGRRAEGQVEEHFLGRLVDRMPRSHRPDADAYLEVLDRALLDRHVSAAEADALVAVAQRLGLGRADVVELHRQYLQALAAFAAADGIVTAEERDDLETVARLLGLGGGQAAQMVRMARHAASLLGAGTSPVPRQRGGGARQRFRLEAGDLVVFTGDMGEPREVWAARAGAAGLRVGAGVTRKTRLLVAADPDTMSGKGKKAAEYGIPVVHPAAFLGMLPSGS
ncbi:exonuclease domain-containing protein [Dactylosporangium sp. CA-139114]|uniref:exonuclease domain-containing protein n=1 Tax=Dactylosporangium sp. CA-139114 TaxID=3239931 RepID=UPI003D981707